ncbi:hypothetical protein TNCV_4255491 [Trichonephila clavipes]|nr:hypothetical protein TNCV_4255491 [Trichonephila clavipes]
MDLPPASSVLVPAPLRQKAVVIEILFVTLPCKPYGGSINRTVTVILRIPFWVFLPHNRPTFLPFKYFAVNMDGFPTATRGLLAMDHVILNHGQVTWMTPNGDNTPWCWRRIRVPFEEYSHSSGHSAHFCASKMKSGVVKSSSNMTTLHYIETILEEQS